MLLRILQWILKKSAGIVLVVTLGVAAIALWLYLHDTLGFEERKAEVLQSITGERARLLEARSEVEKRKEGLSREQVSLEGRIQQADRVIRSLSELESTWDRWFGDSEQQKGYAKRLADLRQDQQLNRARIEEIKGKLRVETYTLEGLDLALGKLERRIEKAKAERSLLMHYLDTAWERCQWYVIAVIAGWFLGPFFWRFAMYFLVSPLVSERRPLRLCKGENVRPEAQPSAVALEIEIEPGYEMRLKERFLQASDEQLRKKTRWFLDWRIPFTSMACGLVELVELRSETGKNPARVTLSCSDDSLSELALLRLPEGSSIILKPRFLAGLCYRSGTKPKIRKHWVFNRWQAWLSLQFRYFEFCGPVDLVIAGSRGLRIEDLSGRGEALARRVNRNAVIAFTSDLEYRPVRAETFWSYYRGMNPLFDDLFTGSGLFVCQANAKQEAQPGERFWTAVWNGVLRLFGL